MALSELQLALLRKTTGDTNAGQYDLTDDEMDAVYTDDALEVFNTAVVYVLRIRLGLAVKWTDRSTDSGNSESRAQRYDHIKTLLDYWEEKTGLVGNEAGDFSASTLDLGLDENEILVS